MQCKVHNDIFGVHQEGKFMQCKEDNDIFGGTSIKKQGILCNVRLMMLR
mgnify:CR=1 FL=1